MTAAMVHVLAAAASAPGNGYGQNDDRMLLLPEHHVYAVADGTGAYGRLADDLLGGIRAHVARHGRPRSIEDLEAAIRSGEAAVAASVEADPRLRGAGTTLDIVAFAEGPALLGIHAGDGRIYRVREGAAERLSVDHTWVEEEVRAGRLQPADARTHVLRNVITRSFLGAGRTELDMLRHPLAIGDRIILCTDGIWKTFDESYFIDILEHSPAALDETLYERSGALRRKPRCVDNATVVVLHVAP